jgi:N-acetylglucosamine-6-phosphate deacetylase
LSSTGYAGGVRLGVEAAVVEGVLVRGDVEVVEDRVAAVGLGGTGRGIAVPGFVDLHIHGFAGVDFAAADAQGYRRAGEALLATGVTAFQPSFITVPEDELAASLRAVPHGNVGPRVIGCHLEGPFISPARLGMHPADAQRAPDRAMLERLLPAGPVTHVTLAPELEGALDLIDLLVARGVVVACGHTDATAAEAHAAFDRGATHVTHLFNAMRPFAHRDPGIAGAALARDDVTVELILDGNHVADDAACVARRAGTGRVALVTDALAAAGVGDGRWHLGAVEVEVRHGVARTAKGALAGSVLTIPEAIRNLVRLGASFEQAIDAATRVPARAARRADLGVLAPGAGADVVVLDDNLEVTRVLVAGTERVAA